MLLCLRRPAEEVRQRAECFVRGRFYVEHAQEVGPDGILYSLQLWYYPEHYKDDVDVERQQEVDAKESYKLRKTTTKMRLFLL